MTEPTEAARLVAKGLALEESGDVAGAEAAYGAAAAHSPSWSVPYYNLGLVCKYQRRWTESLAFNQRAAQLHPQDEAAWWNLGIAASALGNWSEARRAWAACGIQVPAGAGAPDCNFGQTPLRLDPHGNAEVVWAHRIDPARATLISIPLPSSPYHWGDIVLHDGAPEGSRVVDGREYPVFDVLDLLERSAFLTYVVELATSDEHAIRDLEDCAAEMDAAAEHWAQSTRTLCRDCSLGTPHEHRDTDLSPAHPHCGIAARDAQHVERIVQAWLARQPRADLIRWYAAVPA